jgi:hypothetical protein
LPHPQEWQAAGIFTARCRKRTLLPRTLKFPVVGIGASSKRPLHGFAVLLPRRCPVIPAWRSSSSCLSLAIIPPRARDRDRPVGSGGRRRRGHGARLIIQHLAAAHADLLQGRQNERQRGRAACRPRVLAHLVVDNGNDNDNDKASADTAVPAAQATPPFW